MFNEFNPDDLMGPIVTTEVPMSLADIDKALYVNGTHLAKKWQRQFFFGKKQIKPVTIHRFPDDAIIINLDIEGFPYQRLTQKMARISEQGKKYYAYKQILKYMIGDVLNDMDVYLVRSIFGISVEGEYAKRWHSKSRNFYPGYKNKMLNPKYKLKKGGYKKDLQANIDMWESRINKLHRETPDADNLHKAVLDAVFDDDSGVAIGSQIKYWAPYGKSHISLLVNGKTYEHEKVFYNMYLPVR